MKPILDMLKRDNKKSLICKHFQKHQTLFTNMAWQTTTTFQLIRHISEQNLIFSFWRNCLPVFSWPNLREWQILFVCSSCFAEEAVPLSLWNSHQTSRHHKFQWTNYSKVKKNALLEGINQNANKKLK